MPVDDLSVIDFVAINATTGEAMLVIGDCKLPLFSTLQK